MTKKAAVPCSRCINIALSGSSVNRRSSSLRRATVCKAKPLCFCRTFRGWGGVTMLPILSTLLPQMTVSVASRLVAESRDWPPQPNQNPSPIPGHEAHTAICKSSFCAAECPLLSRTPYPCRLIGQTPLHPTGGDVGVALAVLVFSWTTTRDKLINRRAAIGHKNPLFFLAQASNCSTQRFSSGEG